MSLSSSLEIEEEEEEVTISHSTGSGFIFYRKIFLFLLSFAVLSLILGYDEDSSYLNNLRFRGSQQQVLRDSSSSSSENDDDDDDGTTATTTTTTTTSSSKSRKPLSLLDMKDRLKPRNLVFLNENENVTEKHQFLHLHHMKTGGTSMDGRLRCAMNRLKSEKKYNIAYASVHECSVNHYNRCKSKEDERCNKQLADASFMSYCAPLKDLPAFSWNDDDDDDDDSNNINAITVLRNPIERVWSMFRFQTKRCYQCLELTEIYNMIDNGTVVERITDPTCTMQLQNHETANLLSTEWPEEDDGTTNDQAIIDQAIHNMQHFFTVIGLTEHLDDTIEIMGQVFPWFKVNVTWSKTTCPLNHANASPRNNRCGPDGRSHWDLPSYPDEETRKAIIAHNQLDIELYKAAVEHFELQKRALLE